MIDAAAIVISAIGLAISIAAYVRSGDADRRDRQAVIATSVVWSRQGDDSSIMLSRGSVVHIEPNKRPIKPDLRWTIAGKPLVSDGLELRSATPSDDADLDKDGYKSQRIILKFENLGRSAATGLVVGSTLTSTDGQTFDNEIALGAIAVDGCKYVEVRNILSMPLSLSFGFARTDVPNQPVRLSTQQMTFSPRG